MTLGQSTLAPRAPPSQGATQYELYYTAGLGASPPTTSTSNKVTGITPTSRATTVSVVLTGSWGGSITSAPGAGAALPSSIVSLWANKIPEFAYVSSGDRYAIGGNGILGTQATVPAGVEVIDPSNRYAYGLGGGKVLQWNVNSDGSLAAISPPSVDAGSGPIAVAVDPSGKYVYVANSFSNSVSQYTIGAGGTPGALVPMAPPALDAGSQTTFVVTDPSARYVYTSATSGGVAGVSQFSIGADGGLVGLTPPFVDGGSGTITILGY